MNLAMRIFPNTTAYPAPQRRAMAFVWREPGKPGARCFGLPAVAFGEGGLFGK
jgi:hypothetical protein